MLSMRPCKLLIQLGHLLPPPLCDLCGQDQRQYNEPRHDEVAAVFFGEGGAPLVHNDITVYHKEKDCPMQKLSHLSSNCGPMVYPLLFPRGDLAWVLGTPHTQKHCTSKRQTVTHLQYYSYHLAVWEEFAPIHCGRKLFKQYLVDAYMKTDSSCLEFIHSNQNTLWVELYKGLMDHVEKQFSEWGLPAGKIVVLPCSY